jgi:hypothetical protein
VAVTVDRDDPRGGVLYVDGAVVFVFDPTIRALSLDNAAPLIIGYNPDGNTFWNGDVDEVEIFKRALTPLEVHALFKADAFHPAYDDLARAVESLPNDVTALDALVRAAASINKLYDVRSRLTKLAADPSHTAAQLALSRVLASVLLPWPVPPQAGRESLHPEQR